MLGEVVQHFLQSYAFGRRVLALDLLSHQPSDSLPTRLQEQGAATFQEGFCGGASFAVEALAGLGNVRAGVIDVERLFAAGEHTLDGTPYPARAIRHSM